VSFPVGLSCNAYGCVEGRAFVRILFLISGAQELEAACRTRRGDMSSSTEAYA
jgi:hypothetical protein